MPLFTLHTQTLARTERSRYRRLVCSSNDDALGDQSVTMLGGTKRLLALTPTAGRPRDNTCAAALPDLPEHQPELYGLHDSEQSDPRPELHTTPPLPPAQ